MVGKGVGAKGEDVKRTVKSNIIDRNVLIVEIKAQGTRAEGSVGSVSNVGSIESRVRVREGGCGA